jgi:S-adenosylmethionine-dependent methyltransferase
MSAPGSARSTQSAYHRRSSARTAVVWDALGPLLGRDGSGDGDPLEVLDIGGGTGGFAVGVAELGHHVVVVDPSPDALATLARRSAEAGVADRVRGVQGDLATLAELAPASGVDVVLCHGVLEVVDDPRAALAPRRAAT